MAAPAPGGASPQLASLVRRGAALAIDMCIAVCVSAFAFFFLSLAVPLDAEGAKLPVFAIVIAAGLYVVCGRDHVLPSPGRWVFGLRLVRLAGPTLKPATVVAPSSKREEANRAVWAVITIALSSGLAVFGLAQALKSTLVFRAVLDFTALGQPIEAATAGVPRLASVPRALLIGSQSAYVQVSAEWGAGRGVLDFFLARDRRGEWRVIRAREGEPTAYGNYSLAVAEAEVPKPP